MPHSSRNIRDIFLLQVAIVCLVVLFCLIVLQMLDNALVTPWVSFVAVSLALAAVALKRMPAATIRARWNAVTVRMRP